MSKHTLISFLGKQQKGYRTANYELDNQVITTAFFGQELARYIKPDQLLLLGTSGSMWDVFFTENSDDQEKILKLIETDTITEAALAEFEPELRKKLGCNVKCIVIDYAKNEQEQIAILEKIAKELNLNDQISIDVTHSFRHLPMLSLVASRFLKSVKGIQTCQIYYGALEMTENNKTPVIQLNGLLKMLDWVDALSSYNYNGDYQVFSPLFEQENAHQHAQYLSGSSFFENTNQMTSASSNLVHFRKLSDVDNPMMNLFNPILRERTKWVEQNFHSKRQIEMAELHLKKGDFLRACILTQEAWISKMTEQQNGKYATYKYFEREEAEKEFLNSATSENINLFKQLSYIRNAVVHSTKPENKQTISILENREKLTKLVKDSLDAMKKMQLGDKK